MPCLIISDATMQLLIAQATPGADFLQTGKRVGTDYWKVPIADDVAECIEQHRRPGECDDDVICKILRDYVGAKDN